MSSASAWAHFQGSCLVCTRDAVPQISLQGATSETPMTLTGVPGGVAGASVTSGILRLACFQGCLQVLRTIPQEAWGIYRFSLFCDLVWCLFSQKSVFLSSWSCLQPCPGRALVSSLGCARTPRPLPRAPAAVVSGRCGAQGACGGALFLSSSTAALVWVLHLPLVGVP